MNLWTPGFYILQLTLIHVGTLQTDSTTQKQLSGRAIKDDNILLESFTDFPFGGRLKLQGVMFALGGSGMMTSVSLKSWLEP